ncbi:hypothetical protein D8B26_001797 [Coccidioides posadasii str. Silveira]|uniref:Uncharacterized protein n=2 Tax=Coccidioides posadasii TaxID=199306 RepID=E9CWG3_COCPS|nr:conserved hypothetical protein [Coccidioides posadasii str. Silveira]KMM65111.1 hypothetical protein CPAG_01463 [Coccidioides posadasii RMSCC 3488]QVM07094.1 hypothetical protein D8B26_001797 [Coccidioides posadasii str. Silveira]
MRETLDMINIWATKKRFLEDDLIELIKIARNEDYYSLARRVYFDHITMPLVVSPERDMYLLMLRALLETSTWYLLEYHGYQDEGRVHDLPDDDRLREEIHSKIVQETTKELLLRAEWESLNINGDERFHIFTIKGVPRAQAKRLNTTTVPTSICPKLEGPLRVEAGNARGVGRDWLRIESLAVGNGEALDTHFETSTGG